MIMDGCKVWSALSSPSLPPFFLFFLSLLLVQGESYSTVQFSTVQYSRLMIRQYNTSKDKTDRTHGHTILKVIGKGVCSEREVLELNVYCTALPHLPVYYMLGAAMHCLSIPTLHSIPFHAMRLLSFTLL